jgi:hypothetical protein
MRFVGWLLLFLFLGCCLGLGCDGGKEGAPTQTGPLPAGTEKGRLPRRETHRR